MSRLDWWYVAMICALRRDATGKTWPKTIAINTVGALRNLGANLAVAGGLCAAFRCGWEQGMDEAAEGEGYRRDAGPWQPNADGLPAPAQNETAWKWRWP